MKQKIQVIVALAVIIAVAYWAITSLQTRRYAGANIMFPIGSGHVIATNNGDTPIPIEMRSGGRLSTFRVESTQLGLAESSKRQGSGRDAFYNVKFELPPGTARIDVTRGSDLQMIARGETPIEVVVTPLATSTIRWISFVAGAVILYALYFISRVTDHRWLTMLRNRISPKAAPAAEALQA